jgi:hypothetical protein
VTPVRGYAQGPCTGIIEKYGAEEQMGAMNKESSSPPSLVSDTLGMRGGGLGNTSFGSGIENVIELSDGSCGPTSGGLDEHGGEGKDIVSEYLSSESSPIQDVFPL